MYLVMLALAFAGPRSKSKDLIKDVQIKAVDPNSGLSDLFAFHNTHCPMTPVQLAPSLPVYESQLRGGGIYYTSRCYFEHINIQADINGLAIVEQCR